MEKISEVLNAWWFQAAASGALGVALIIYGYPLYAGIALGWGICKFVSYLKSSKQKIKLT